jgi:hypothetical protein
LRIRPALVLPPLPTTTPDEPPAGRLVADDPPDAVPDDDPPLEPLRGDAFDPLLDPDEDGVRPDGRS